MRIVYLSEVNIDINSGVLTKMNGQIEQWCDAGHEVCVICFPAVRVNKRNIKLTKKAHSYDVIESKLVPKFLNGGLFNLSNKVLGTINAEKILNKIDPDIVYIRELVAFPGLSKMLRKRKVVLESNTLLRQELDLYSFKARALFKLFQKGFYRAIDGFVGVTQEIANQFTGYKKSICTISNGIDISVYRPFVIGSVIKDSKRASLILVGTPNQAWHGADKFYKLASLLPDFDFHLVGIEAEHFMPLTNFIVHGYMDREELIKLYANIDIGVGTLALHRKGMDEACPLKVREYAAIGLPIIIAYTDSDFSGQEFVLELPNAEDNVESSIIEIANFVTKWKGQRIDESLATKLVSAHLKEQIRLSFMKNVAQIEI